MSPEAAAYLTLVSLFDTFQEHATLRAGFSLPGHTVPETTWPLPAEIPWADVQLDAWHRLGVHDSVPHQESTAWFASFSRAVERSLDGHVTALPNSRLPTNCFGRGSRTAPQHSRPGPQRPLKASRPGEDSLVHDGLSTEVRRWFQQLRRLQSLVHAVKAGNLAPSAVSYRLDLWRSILHARGFRYGFESWWRSRPAKLVGSPATLPRAVPAESCLCAIHEDFRHNFRKLESWHLRHRTKILDAKYDKSLAQIQKELRAPASEQVDTLQFRRSHAILATAPSGVQVHVEGPLDLRGSSAWAIDGEPVDLISCEDNVCTFASPVSPVGLELEQLQTLSSVADVHSEFVSVWAARWQQHTSADWSRFLNFVRAFLPSRPFDLPDIDASMWSRALRRFKPRAARGPDGWARDDLLKLPPQRTAELLRLLRAIETETQPWPRQLLVGFVCLLSKDNGRTDTQGYRPICVYSIIYRAWAGIRAQQVLRILRGLVPEDLFGFIPGHETTELWYVVQLEVEQCCQTGDRLLGMSTDIVKCFNHLPRLPLLGMAAHVGFPARLLGPWCNFLQSTERRFLVRGQVSPPVSSSGGFPEGCPLSPVAMVLADWAFHVYMKAFLPPVRPLSYVDNLACLARSPFDLARAFNLVQCFMEMLQLALDASKTYVWATDASARKSIACLGPPVVEATRELGGIMSFGASARNAALKDRCQALGPTWKALARSRAPACLKILTLPSKCWAKAMHGIAGAPLAEAQLQQLRTAATTAIKLRPAGVSSLLRLSLSSPATADPGFYQLWCCARDLRRMAGKLPNFLSHWRSFAARYDGRQLHGPFTKLVQVFAQIGWSVQTPPVVMDHEGLLHNFLMLPLMLLRRLLEHAWLQYVASRHTHRAAMFDLKGLDPALLQADLSRLSALDNSRLATVRAGAFLFGHQHAHYDLRKDGLCPQCQQPDTVEHRVRFCPRYADLRKPHQWVCDAWPSFPRSLSHHLLPSANPHLPALRGMLQATADTTGVFFSSGFGDGWQHVFTDGSCLDFASPDLALAGWGLIHAHGATALACGVVPGLLQSAPRAELCAMKAAARWAIFTRRPCIVWSDALNVVEGVHALQEGRPRPSAADSDLWAELAALLEQLPQAKFLVHHTPSHLDTGLTDSPFEDWLAAHNGHADTLAGLANHNRPQALQTTHAAALQYHNTTLEALRALRAIFFGIAEQSRHTASQANHAAEDDEEFQAPPTGCSSKLVDLEEVLSLDWRSQLGSCTFEFPKSFAETVCDFLFRQDSLATDAHVISWLELVFILHDHGIDPYPACDVHGHWVAANTLAFSPPAHTVAVRLSLLRRGVRPALRGLGLDSLLTDGINRSDLGVGFVLDGITIGVPTSDVLRARSGLGRFVQGRAAGSKAVLARPI